MSDLRRALLERTPCFGTWMQIGHAAVAEVLCGADFDWIAVDMEHTDIDVAGFTDVARGLFGRGPAPLARVRENDTLAIRQVLDAGAEGVIVPLVNSAEEARRAVAAAKFPPEGVRGFCFSRMNDYGASFEDYARRANDDIAVVVMIESREAVESLDSILAVEGVDGVFIGPYDLSGSYGVPGALDDPRVVGAIDRVASACREAGKSAGMHIVVPAEDAIQRAVDGGFTFLALGVDSVFLSRGGREVLGMARGCVRAQ